MEKILREQAAMVEKERDEKDMKLNALSKGAIMLSHFLCLHASRLVWDESSSKYFWSVK